MKLISKHLPGSCRILIFGCVHIGALNHSKHALKHLISELGKSNTYGINLGDNLEAITPMDKRFSFSAVDVEERLLTPQDQADRFVKLFKPVKDKLLGIGMGNHELKLMHQIDYGKYISRELDVPYGGYVYKFIHLDKKKIPQYKLYLHHGFGVLKSMAKDPVQRKANMMSALKQKCINTNISDCIGMFMAHFHKQLTVEPTYLDETLIIDRDGKITQHLRSTVHQSEDYVPADTRWYSSVGCFRRTYTQHDDDALDYGEMMGFGATDLGWVELRIEDYKLVAVKEVEAGE